MGGKGQCSVGNKKLQKYKTTLAVKITEAKEVKSSVWRKGQKAED